MLYVHHRINTAEQLKNVPKECGIEIDLRDRGDRLICVHDPFSDGEDFHHVLDQYNHALIILNIKSERIEHRALQLIEQRNIENYFLLDCSFPMIQTLASQGQTNIAVRFSEYEPLEQALALADQVRWVWVDCFTKMPLTPQIYDALKMHFKLCLVSPELQGRPAHTIPDYAQQIAPFPPDAICTKRPDLWQQTHTFTSSHPD